MTYTGIDIGGTKTAVVLADESGAILKKERFATTNCRNTLKEIFEAIDKIGCGDRIGISCGGPLDEKRGIIMSPPNLPDWDGIHITEMLTERYSVPAAIMNDANACALAENMFGAGRGTENMIFLTFGTGLGAGIILDGRLYSGTNGNGGEVGHIRLRSSGPIGYRKKGSFEGFCSGNGIRQLGQAAALKALKKGIAPLYCRNVDEIDDVTAKTVAEAANMGDETAIGVYKKCGTMMGEGLAVLVDLFNPEAIVIGGIYPRSEHLLKPYIMKSIKKEALEASLSVCRILPAQLGESIGDMAAVTVAKSI